MDTARERFYFANTLLCLLKAVEGKKTTIELHGEKEIYGTVVQVDGYMNITMKDVTYTTPKSVLQFEHFFVNGKSIRYVHIPDEIDMKQAMEQQLKKADRSQAAQKVRQDIKDAAWIKMGQKEARRKKQAAKAEKQKTKVTATSTS